MGQISVIACVNMSQKLQSHTEIWLPLIMASTHNHICLPQNGAKHIVENRGQFRLENSDCTIAEGHEKKNMCMANKEQKLGTPL